LTATKDHAAGEPQSQSWLLRVDHIASERRSKSAKNGGYVATGAKRLTFKKKQTIITSAL
jgi:hypothetical protein